MKVYVAETYSGERVIFLIKDTAWERHKSGWERNTAGNGDLKKYRGRNGALSHKP